ncbi:unnamed protein product [Rhizoctonia solani]|uniref:Uncharacterized protein n=1 Tax=Rhizoctonia solani TaxID=456999 RepID=A0A8H3B116_9AGAM|nr:unnamed protein product [Rhizoctonia solani]
MRRVDLDISIFSAILAFIPSIDALNVQQDQDSLDYTTFDNPPNVKIEFNINGPINIYPPHEFNHRFSDRQPDIVSWRDGWYFAVALLFVSVYLLWPRLRPEQKLPSSKGRTAAIASGRGLDVGDRDRLCNASGGASLVSPTRGRQLTTQVSNEGPRPVSPPLRVTESPASVKIIDKSVDLHVAQAERSLPVDQEEKVDVHQERVARPRARPRLQPSTRIRGAGAPVASSTPLKASLYEQVRWFILVIAVNHNGRTDPENDLRFWIATLWDSTHQRVTFKSLAGAKATLKNIENELTLLCSQARRAQGISRSHLLVYLTGEGDGAGGMYLSDATSISSEHIKLWLRQLQVKWKLDRPPTVVFDMCRYGADPNEPIIDMGPDMNIIYSCSPAEGALAMSFRRSDILFSAFALAFVMTSCNPTYLPNDSREEVTIADPGALKEALQEHLGKLANVVNLARRSGLAPVNVFAYALSKFHNVFRPRDLGLTKDLVPQTPDWRQARDLELIIDLADMISKMEKVREVHTFITTHDYFLDANSVSDPAPKYGPTLKNRTTQHHRGASKSAPVTS